MFYRHLLTNAFSYLNVLAYVRDDVIKNINFRIIFKCTFIFFLFAPSMRYKCKRPDFTHIFVDSVDSLNSPVYFAPPCIIIVIYYSKICIWNTKYEIHFVTESNKKYELHAMYFKYSNTCILITSRPSLFFCSIYFILLHMKPHRNEFSYMGTGKELGKMTESTARSGRLLLCCLVLQVVG